MRSLYALAFALLLALPSLQANAATTTAATQVPIAHAQASPAIATHELSPIFQAVEHEVLAEARREGKKKRESRVAEVPMPSAKLELATRQPPRFTLRL